MIVSSSKTVEKKLPLGWKQKISKTKNKIYYYNEINGKTQWNVPENSIDKRKRNDDEENIEKNKLLQFLLQSIKIGTAKLPKSIYWLNKDDIHKYITPWNHQTEAIVNILFDLKFNINNNNRYLIQHSTGTGKSLTIAALTHQLFYYSINGQNKRIYNLIIIVVDRITLDKQLGDTIESYLFNNGIFMNKEFFRTDNIKELFLILSDHTIDNNKSKKQKIIITTIQKLALLMDNNVMVEKLGFYYNNNKIDHSLQEICNDNNVINRKDDINKIAIIIDEAHRSYGANKNNIFIHMTSQLGMDNKNITYIAFSATPSKELVLLFGQKSQLCKNKNDNEDNEYTPFHIYPMKLAIKNNHIINVLDNYLSVHLHMNLDINTNDIDNKYENHLYIRENIENIYKEYHIELIEMKINIILNHFSIIKSNFKLAKCMIIASTREDVISYYKLLEKVMHENRHKHKYNIFCLFSGSLQIHDLNNTIKKLFKNHDNININITDSFINNKNNNINNSDIIIVCDKLETGYNEPLLVSMYLDRYIRTKARTVQLFSRLNRRFSGKENVYVVDFKSHPFQIAEHFTEYWLKESIINTEITDISHENSINDKKLISANDNSPNNNNLNNSLKYKIIVEIIVSKCGLISLFYSEYLIYLKDNYKSNNRNNNSDKIHMDDEKFYLLIMQKIVLFNPETYKQFIYFLNLYLNACYKIKKQYFGLPYKFWYKIKQSLQDIGQIKSSNAHHDNNKYMMKPLNVYSKYSVLYFYGKISVDWCCFTRGKHYEGFLVSFNKKGNINITYMIKKIIEFIKVSKGLLEIVNILQDLWLLHSYLIDLNISRLDLINQIELKYNEFKQKNIILLNNQNENEIDIQIKSIMNILTQK